MQTAFFLAYVAVLVLSLGLSWVNLRHQRREGHRVPPELADVVDPERLRKIAAYSADQTRFGMVSRVLRSAGFALFLFGGLLGLYDELVSGFTPSPVVHGVAFVLGLVLLGAVLELPFDAYHAFRIEARHGFNRMTWGLFFADWVKSTLLSVVLLGLLALAAFSLVSGAPSKWWFWVWALFVAFSLVLTFVTPYVIEPLFFKIRPLAAPGLEAEVRALAERAGVHVGRVLEIDASRRSAHSNAYFTGLGRVKRVVLFDTLLGQMTEREVLAVLSHELGHWKKHHVLVRTIASFGIAFVALYLLSRFVAAAWVPELAGIEHASFAARAVILGTLASVAMFPLRPLFAAWSRRDEWQADRFAVDLSGYALELASALAKLSRENLANLHPHPLYAKFYYSHPPVPERIRRLREAAAAQVT